jgi:hypothetical protein
MAVWATLDFRLLADLADERNRLVALSKELTYPMSSGESQSHSMPRLLRKSVRVFVYDVYPPGERENDVRIRICDFLLGLGIFRHHAE